MSWHSLYRNLVLVMFRDCGCWLYRVLNWFVDYSTYVDVIGIVAIMVTVELWMIFILMHFPFRCLNEGLLQLWLVALVFGFVFYICEVLVAIKKMKFPHQTKIDFLTIAFHQHTNTTITYFPPIFFNNFFVHNFFAVYSKLIFILHITPSALSPIKN